MPSGAKKRKAAKKKKEQQSNNSSSVDNSSPRGNDDPKSQDESDGGEVGSPASLEHNSEQHPFNEDNEESDKKDSSSFASGCTPVEGVTKDAEGSQKVGVEDNTAVTIERELNPEQYMESKDINVEHVESAKDSHDGDDKSSRNSSDKSSRNSSDGESRVFDIKWKEEANSASSNVEKVFPEEVTQIFEIGQTLEEAAGNLVAKTVPTGLATPVLPMYEVAKHVMEGAEVENSEVLDVVEPGLKENEDKFLLQSSDVVSALVPEKNKDNFFPVLDKNVGPSTDVICSTANGNEDKTLTLSGAYSAETSLYAENVNDSGNSNGTVIANEPMTKMSKSSGNYTSETSNDADKAKDTEISRYTESQPLVPPAPQVSQRTSWMSCCGLFEVFTVSNR